MRSDELYLTLAEAYAHLKNTEQALSVLNQVRSARINNVQAYTTANLPEVNRTALIQEDAEGLPLTKLMHAILNERRKELFMEGDRWFELKRNGRPEFWVGNNGLKYTTKKYMYTFPLPRVDVEIIPGLKQNEGYE